MSQDDYSVANAAGSTVRADINSQLSAIVTWNSGTGAPATTFARQRWVDTTNGVVKRRNAANSAWLIESTDDETRVVARASNTMLDASDVGKTFIATSTFTQTLDAAATLADGWHVWYRNDGAGIITIDPNASENIDGATTMQLFPGEAVRIACDGSGFKTTSGPRPSFKAGSFTRDISTASGSQAVTGVGFKPRALLVFAVVDNTSQMSVGMADGTTDNSVADRNGVSANQYAASGNLIELIVSGAAQYSGTLSSFDNDGFTISWTKTGSPTGTATCYYMAYR